MKKIRRLLGLILAVYAVVATFAPLPAHRFLDPPHYTAPYIIGQVAVGMLIAWLVRWWN